MTNKEMEAGSGITRANTRLYEIKRLWSPARVSNGYREYSEHSLKEVSHMTIKEMEVRSGMTRANIRFYETEGLLSPVRASNGYREYSEANLEVLKRIKLLRTLSLSLEEIKSLHTEAQELPATLDAHLNKLSWDKTMIEHSKEICQTMHHDGAQYQTLDAQHYLDEIENKMQKPVPELTTDATEKVLAPWRRFFARSLDGSIYVNIVFFVTSLIPNLDSFVNQANYFERCMFLIPTLLLMMYIEPALLSHFGTTMGKWILGLYVTDKEGQRLSYDDALSRTRIAIGRGEGFYIPIYCFVRNLISYEACKRGETMEWEHDSIIVLKDKKEWRIALYTVAYLMLLAITMFA